MYCRTIYEHFFLSRKLNALITVMSKSWVYVGHQKNFNQKNLPLAKKVKNKKKVFI